MLEEKEKALGFNVISRGTILIAVAEVGRLFNCQVCNIRFKSSAIRPTYISREITDVTAQVFSLSKELAGNQIKFGT
jgi:hypothetical protein